MAKREYGQFCGLARALEIVGERWALLIVRDLLTGPKRYTDLRRGLPRIPTNVLATRLRELERAGAAQRRILPRPDGSIVYELTDYGRELETAVMSLSRWGARSLGEPTPDQIVTPASLIMAMRTTFRPEVAGDVEVSYELRIGAIILHVRVTGGGLEVGEGPLPEANLVIESGPVFKSLMAGEVSPADAVANGEVRLAGDAVLLDRFAEMFRV